MNIPSDTIIPGISVPEKRNWRQALAAYRHPRIIGMLFLGFAAGLPLLLVFSTLTLWFNDAGISKKTIGLVALIGTFYSIKIFWSPIVDRVPLPWIDRALGRRRSWMLMAQCGIILGLIIMALNDPLAAWDMLGLTPGDQPQANQLPASVATAAWVVVGAGVLVAFASATQDIAMDAYRIEAVPIALQGAISATYQLGYRLGMLMAGAGALWIADIKDWSFAYLTMASCMSVGIFALFLTPEPEGNHRLPVDPVLWRTLRRLRSRHKDRYHPKLLRLQAWFIGAIIRPFHDFFLRNGLRIALLILIFIGSYRISDLVMGVMANPFYSDIGFTKSQIAGIAKFYGVLMTLIGAFTGGIIVSRYGAMIPLLIGSLLVAATNLLFVWLARAGADLTILTFTISADNFSGGFAASAFIAFLAGLTNRNFTATQYALFSSFMTLPGKLISSQSGYIVEDVGFELFFLYAAAMGIPAILLVLVLMRMQHRIGAGTFANQDKELFYK